MNRAAPAGPGTRSTQLQAVGRSGKVGKGEKLSCAWGLAMTSGRPHAHAHAFTALRPLEREGLTLLSRRNMLKASLAGLAGLSVPALLRQRACAVSEGRPTPEAK